MIVWDLGGVVARFEPAARLAALAESTRLPAQQVDGALLSWRLRAVKSNPLAYHRAAGLLETPPADLTLIDDRMPNVATARRAGWNAIHFTRIEDLEPPL